MYSTCLFCHATLGTNESIEHFPVGKRLAFDAAKGRLWVVCRSCARWNLTPLEVRWEAIEECERLFHDTKLRVATDQIGLARLREGTTLVRIGEPQRPEMTAWRYGDQFHRRRRKYVAIAAASVVGAGTVVIGGPMAGLLSWGTALTLFNLGSMVRDMRNATRVPIAGKVLRLDALSLSSVQIRPNVGNGFVIRLTHTPPTFKECLRAGLAGQQQPLTLDGNDALRAARTLLPLINKAGGRPSEIQTAVGILERGRSLDDMFSDAARTSHESLARWKRPFNHWVNPNDPFVLAPSLPASVRLALEMALHEADERRAFEGELAELEERWREAEEIAAIADDLLVSPAVSDRLERLGRKR